MHDNTLLGPTSLDRTLLDHSLLDRTLLDSGGLHAGEYFLEAAPVVTLANGNNCVPQQFLGFEHSLDTVETLIKNISFAADFPIFVSQDDGGLFIQIGIIGRENYSRAYSARPKKIVYGRKWRVEANLPTSEIIQSVFLAIKKAREHELREFLSLYDLNTNKRSTPFNSHHDLPLIARNEKFIFDKQTNTKKIFDKSTIEKQLQQLRFAERPIFLKAFYQRANGQYLLDLFIAEPPKARLAEKEYCEFNNLDLTLVLKKACLNELLYELMAELIKVSDRFVDEHFKFKGFTRFSRNNSINDIGQFSICTRNIQDPRFDAYRRAVIKNHHQSIDITRVPAIKNTQKQRLSTLFSPTENLEGFLPR